MQTFKCISKIAAFLIISFYGFSQTIHSSIVHDGLTRTFSFYVPSNYINGKPTPLVFNLHGYTSNGDEQEFYGDFRKIADTADFIIVHPDGTYYPNTTNRFWNCGLVGSSGVDDVGFIHSLIDTLSKAYSINPERIYSTGMSNGGFMSYHLACVSNRFAAIASVAGSMTALTLLQCKNANAIPVMEIHGNADPVVNYDGSTGVMSIPAVLDYWITKNGLNKQDLVLSSLPDINTADGATAELYIYPGLNEVEHYKILNGGHTWPGTPFVIGTTCQDFNASEVIWQFFNRYKRQTVGSTDLNVVEFSVFPNPATNVLKIIRTDFNNQLMDIQCINQFGEVVKKIHLRGMETLVDISDLVEGVYFMEGRESNKVYRTKLIKL